MKDDDRVTTPMLLADLNLMAAWMNRFLTSTPGEDSPNREVFISMMEEVRFLAEGNRITDYGLVCALSIKHYMAIGGIPHAEVFPGEINKLPALFSPFLDRRSRKDVDRT